ncbi:MAG: hypothetical protein EOO71_16580 [Myxococcaceae bacterium]|nr:MAG: hypothetical protein EOO71_16580 [Myxococcaceae bacterium]
MYAKLYQTRYGTFPGTVDLISTFAGLATDNGGTLECGFSQGCEDLVAGVPLHSQRLTRDGICYALVAMWLRMKFEKKPDSDFYVWLFAKDVAGRNARMSQWMHKQLFAKGLGNPKNEEVHSEFMAVPESARLRQEFKARYPKEDLPAYLNFVSEIGDRGSPLDASYDPAKYAGMYQRARYELATDPLSYKLTHLNSRLGRLEIWQEADVGRDDVYVHQLAASKITSSATKDNHLSSKDRIVSATLQSSYVPDKDKARARKRTEACALLVDAMVKYKRKLKNEDAFVTISFCKHVVGVFFSRSPWSGNSTLYCFDPNYGIWRFESGSEVDRFESFKKFFFALTYMYREMDSLLLTIVSRH